jgi:hypothetical protein
MEKSEQQKMIQTVKSVIIPTKGITLEEELKLKEFQIPILFSHSTASKVILLRTGIIKFLGRDNIPARDLRRLIINLLV